MPFADEGVAFVIMADQFGQDMHDHASVVRLTIDMIVDGLPKAGGALQQSCGCRRIEQVGDGGVPRFGRPHEL